jgi:hypothetical protein
VEYQRLVTWIFQLVTESELFIPHTSYRKGSIFIIGAFSDRLAVACEKKIVHHIICMGR